MFEQEQYDAALDRLDYLEASLKQFPCEGSDNIASNCMVLASLVNLLRDCIGIHAILIRHHDIHTMQKEQPCP